MTTIPVQLDQLLTLALSVVFVTQALKAVAARIDVEVGGKGAVVVSAVVAVLLTLAAYGAGWVPVTLPACQVAESFACVQGWLATVGAVLALVNGLYAAVYGRVSSVTEATMTD
jgi:hypothetical protein